MPAPAPSGVSGDPVLPPACQLLVVFGWMKYSDGDPPSRLAGWAQRRLRAASAFSTESRVTKPQQAPTPIRTNVYVDGFNLYYGCVKGTPYKWLNIAELCRLSLPSHFQIHRIRYFTALVKPRPNDPHQGVRQQTFIRALQTLPNLSVHYGEFLQSNVRMHLVNPPTAGATTALVVKTEEKGSDVNLATYLLVDAYEQDFEAAVVMTDDSDLAEPITIVRRRLKHHVTVLSPRGKSRTLSHVATRFRQIDVAHLAASQFPQTLTDQHGTITKPATW
jgi:NYN domain